MQSNIFCIDKDEFTVHWQITAPAESVIVQAFADGTEQAKTVVLTPGQQVTVLADLTNKLLVSLKEQGYKPDPSKAARKGGGGSWGQPKPEIPAPDERVPEHCGQPMKYVKFTDKNQKEREKYECRKGKECSAANQYGGHTIWRDQWVKQMGNGVQDDNPFHDDPIKSLV